MKLLPKIKTPCWKRCADVASTMSASKNGIDAPSRYCFTGVFLLLSLLSCSKPVLTVSIPDVPVVIQSERPLFKLGMPFGDTLKVEPVFASMPVWSPVVEKPKIVCASIRVDTVCCKCCEEKPPTIEELGSEMKAVFNYNEKLLFERMRNALDLDSVWRAKYEQQKWRKTKRDVVLATWILGVLGSVLLVAWLIDKTKN